MENFSSINVQYIVDRRVVTSCLDFFDLIDGYAWIEEKMNKLALTNDIEIARRTETPLFGSNPEWIWQSQHKLFLDFILLREFNGKYAYQLIKNPSTDPVEYENMKAAALQYANDVRDIFRMKIIEAKIFLNNDDPRISENKNKQNLRSV